MHGLTRVKRFILQRRLEHELHQLFHFIAHLDFAVYDHDQETGDEVARAIRRSRRRAAVFAAALQTARLPTPKGTP